MNRIAMLVGEIAVIIFMLLHATLSFAHSPHDIIFDVVLSPAYDVDKTVFIIVSNTLEISTDEGCSWKKLVNGLDYSSQLTSIAISPTFGRDRTVLVTSENDGIYRSQNGGKSWERANSGLKNFNIRSIKLSPGFLDKRTAVAVDATGRLYQSMDSARTWKPLDYDFDSKITCLAYLTSKENNRLIAGTDGGYVLLSDKSRSHWEKISIPMSCTKITSITVSPHFKEDKKIWVGSEGCGIFEVNIEAKSCSDVNQKLSDKKITSLLAIPGLEDKTVLYASSYDEGIFKLTATKRAWVKQDKGLTTDPQAKDPHFLMPNFKGIAARKEILFLGGFDGLFKSIDEGRTWRQLDTIILSGITGLAVHAEKGAKKHKVALVTYGAGAYLYDSSGQNWSIINRGLQWTRLNDVAFSPNYKNDGVIFSGSERNFLLFDSKDNAWRRIPVSVSFKRRLARRIDHFLKKIEIGVKWRNKIYRPLPSDTLFPTHIGLSPEIAMDKTLYFGTRSSGVYLTDDGGSSNSPIWEANNKLVTALCLSPRYAKDRIVFTGLYGAGIFKSKNKGRSWRKIDKNIAANKQVRLAISPDFSNDHTLVTGNATGLYLSTDGGEKWNPIGREDLGPTPNVVCVAISPMFEEDRMFLVGIGGKGLWVTQDRGVTFSPIAKELIDKNYQAKFVKFSTNYRADGTIYCASSFELFRSLDRGRSWHVLPRPIRYENFREEIKYTGDWQIVRDDRYSALSASYANKAGSRLRLRFTGTGITWIGDKSPLHGQAEIYIDDSPVKIVSQTSEMEQKSIEIFSMTGLEERSHELAIEIICSEQNTECNAVSIDAIDVIPHEYSDILP